MLALQGKLKHTLTLHLKSSAFEVLGWAAEYMRALSRMYTAYRAWFRDNVSCFVSFHLTQKTPLWT